MIIILSVIAIWNVLTFCTYWYDKRLARRKNYRISEQTLLLMSLCLGGLGASLGGYLCHHKTRKWYFRITWLISLVILGVIMIVIWRI